MLPFKIIGEVLLLHGGQTEACRDCVSSRLEGRGICKSECPTCHMPIWKKDLVADGQLDSVVVKVTSALPGLGTAGVLNVPQAKGCSNHDCIIPSSSVPEASEVRLPCMPGCTKRSTKRSSTTELQAATKCPRVLLPVDPPVEHATSKSDTTSTVSHQVAEHPRNGPGAEAKDTSVHPAVDVGVNVRTVGLQDPVPWEGEPDWLAAYEPTQQPTTQVYQTQPCYFEALLATSRPKESKAAGKQRAPCMPVHAEQVQASQPHTSTCLLRQLSGKGHGEATLKKTALEREGAPAEQPVSTPLFTRRRNRSGAEPETDRSNDPASTAAALCPLPKGCTGATAAHASPSKAPSAACLVPVANASEGGPTKRDELGTSDAFGDSPDVRCPDHSSPAEHPQEPAQIEAPSAMGGSPSAAKPDQPQVQDAPIAPILVNAPIVAIERATEDRSAVCGSRGRKKGNKRGQDDGAPPAARPAKPGKRKRAAGRRRAASGRSMPAQQDTAPSPQTVPKKSEVSPACRPPGLNDTEASGGEGRGLQQLAVDSDRLEQQGQAGEGQGLQENARIQNNMHSSMSAQGDPPAGDDTGPGVLAAAQPPAARRRRARQASTDPAFAITPKAASCRHTSVSAESGQEVAGAADTVVTTEPQQHLACDVSASRCIEKACRGRDATAVCKSPEQPHPDVELDKLAVDDRVGDEAPRCDHGKENSNRENGMAGCAPGGGGAQLGVDVRHLLSSGDHAATNGDGLAVAASQDVIVGGFDEADGQTGSQHGSRSPELKRGRRDDHVAAAAVHMSPERSMQQTEVDGADQACHVMQSDGEGAGDQADVNWEACATPDGQVRSSMVGPGFVSASELLESQRSGRILSFDAARSPVELPEVLVSLKLATGGLDEHRPPSQAGCLQGNPIVHPVERLRDAREDEAVLPVESSPIRSSHHESIDCDLVGLVEEPGPDMNTATAEPEAADTSPVPALSPPAAASDAADHADALDVDVSRLAQWDALTGAEGSVVLEQWNQVIRRLPKRMPRQVVTALLAELHGMQRAHATLCRLMQKLQDTTELLPEAAAVSQADADPATQDQIAAAGECRTMVQNEPVDGAAAQGQEDNAAAQPRISQRIAEPSSTQQPHEPSSDPQTEHADVAHRDGTIATQDAAARSCAGLSQCLLQGWTCGPSQVRCQTVDAPSGLPAVAADGDVPQTPIRRRGNPTAGASPPCIPDTPSESESVPGCHAAGAAGARAGKQEQCGSPSMSASLRDVMPWQTQTRVAGPEPCQTLSGSHAADPDNEQFDSGINNLSDHNAAVDDHGTDTILVHGFQLTARRKKGRLSRRSKV